MMLVPPVAQIPLVGATKRDRCTSCDESSAMQIAARRSRLRGVSVQQRADTAVAAAATAAAVG